MLELGKKKKRLATGCCTNNGLSRELSFSVLIVYCCNMVFCKKVSLSPNNTSSDPRVQLVEPVVTKKKGEKFRDFGLWPILVSFYKSYLVDPASSHMLVSKIKPCMSKYKQLYTVKLRMAH